jgi:SRSO17 transposase
MELFIPESWDNGDAECIQRRAKTKMPDSVHYRPKWRIALELLDEARARQVPHWAMVADSWYGNISEFRQELVRRDELYILGVYSDTQVFLEPPTVEHLSSVERKRGRPRKKDKVFAVSPDPIKVSAVGAAIADDAWERLTIRRDSRNKPLVVEAVSRRVYPAHGWRNGVVHEDVWLLIERRHLGKGEIELRYFFSNMPQTTPTLHLAKINHERYWIEHGYQQLKEELGLDHHEGRSWLGWHRHVLLTFLAYGYLTLIRLEQKKQQNLSMWIPWLLHQGILEKEYFF